ncbi:thaumatin-like protein 1b [Salvia hispanica]|uniref:thaumatin-like protein 1b n=1 Tax=Salvia hispanica TaxID=49212 RepID=UPI00200996C4|nr:thaumatin-like protein 1b [Salvia hispanica]
MGKLYFHILFLIISNSFIAEVYSSAKFTIVNKCQFTVWPAIWSSTGSSPPPTTGFALHTGESRIVNAPSSWAGRFWGRMHCSEDPPGNFSCLTGDCGSGKVECGSAAAAAIPVTLAEFALDTFNGMDFYDLSLVDGYNLPILVAPHGRNCSETECGADLDSECPPELRVTSAGGEQVACRRPCEPFKTQRYCCSESLAACKPTLYAQAFKRACPQAYSYARDDGNTTFTCTGADYNITFCPPRDVSKKSSPGAGGSNTTIDGHMVYEGAVEVSSAPATYRRRGGNVAVELSLLLLVVNTFRVGPFTG